MIIVLTLLCCVFGTLSAHQPTFMPRPETLWKGGIGLENALYYSKQGATTKAFLEYELSYGFKEFLTASFRLPFALKNRDATRSTHHLGDALVGFKWRVFKEVSPGVRDQVSVITKIILPTSDVSQKPSLSRSVIGFAPNSGGVQLGVTAGHETLTWFLYGSVVGEMSPEFNHSKKGNTLLYSGAIAYRPWKVDFEKPDLAFLIELNGIVTHKHVVRDVISFNSGGHVLFIGPSFGLGIQNVFIKGGIQLPLTQSLNGTLEKFDWRGGLSFIANF